MNVILFLTNCFCLEEWCTVALTHMNDSETDHGCQTKIINYLLSGIVALTAPVDLSCLLFK